ncbi:MAG: hypothetical protein IPJ46_00505 [Anaerolineales bacterium]|nr:hypothetical protein [Anaerolineales bacterium]
MKEDIQIIERDGKPLEWAVLPMKNISQLIDQSELLKIFATLIPSMQPLIAAKRN